MMKTKNSNSIKYHKEKLRRRKTSNIVYNIFNIIGILLFVWFLISFVDVTLHNIEGLYCNEVGPRLNWNFFVVLFEYL